MWQRRDEDPARGEKLTVGQLVNGEYAVVVDPVVFEALVVEARSRSVSHALASLGAGGEAPNFRTTRTSRALGGGDQERSTSWSPVSTRTSVTSPSKTIGPIAAAETDSAPPRLLKAA